ncbi:MAG: Flp1 family type IVb pilin [Lachnospiraceae bacterium]
MHQWFLRTKTAWRSNSGMGVIELILIIVVLIGLVIIFKSQITSLVNNILSKITSQANSI